MAENEIIGNYDANTVKIKFSGSDNRVQFGKNFKTSGLILHFEGDNGHFIIGDNSQMNGKARIGAGCSLIVGNRLLSLFNNAYFLGESTSITIGDDCLLSGGIIFRTDDSHAIYDVESGERVNKAGNIVIGNHVWICEGCRILKNTIIKDGSVIAMDSLLSSCVIANNCIAGGTPFRYLRKNIAWEKPYLGGELFKKGLKKSAYWNLTNFDDQENPK